MWVGLLIIAVEQFVVAVMWLEGVRLSEKVYERFMDDWEY